jgi:hypothetical protein
LELCASIQVQCWQTVLCSESRPNAKPETVTSKFGKTKQNKMKITQLTFLLLSISVNSFAQEIEYKLIPGITKTDVTLGNEFVFACKLNVEETLKPETTIFLYGIKHCSRGYDVTRVKSNRWFSVHCSFLFPIFVFS